MTFSNVDMCERGCSGLPHRQERGETATYIHPPAQPAVSCSIPAQHACKLTKHQIHKSTQSNDLIESPSNPRSTSAAKSVKHVYYSASYILALPRLYGLIPSSSTHNPASRTYISLTQPALIAQSLPTPCPSSPPKAAPNPPIQSPEKSATESLLTTTRKPAPPHSRYNPARLPTRIVRSYLRPPPNQPYRAQHWTLVSRMGHLP